MADIEVTVIVDAGPEHVEVRQEAPFNPKDKEAALIKPMTEAVNKVYRAFGLVEEHSSVPPPYPDPGPK